MKIESYKRAGELLPLIENAKENIDRWEKATSFKENESIDCIFNPKGYSYVRVRHIPFDVAKAISIACYKKELEQLENELNSL